MKPRHPYLRFLLISCTSFAACLRRRTPAILLILSILTGCEPTVNKRVTLWRNDKIPYGTYYSYNNLHYFFHNAEIETSSRSPANLYEEPDSSGAYIVIGNTVRPDEKELKAILNYASAGNHVFISAMDIGGNVLDSFHLGVSISGGGNGRNDSLTVSVLEPGTENEFSFSYPGFSMNNVFTRMDSSITNIIGKNENGKANFVRFTYEGGGSVSLHLEPAAFTNFFLLHKENKRYYDFAMSTVPGSVRHVKWDDYFRHHINGDTDSQNSAFSKLAAFLKHPVLKWAFWLAVLLFALIYLFESKRKQRPIPVVKKLRNSTLDFVQTVGRLYYQRRDNKDLAAKMIAHFLGHVRTKFNLSTSRADEAFERKLSFKSGYPIDQLTEITSFIRQVDSKAAVSDAELLEFNNKIEAFYKQT